MTEKPTFEEFLKFVTDKAEKIYSDNGVFVVGVRKGRYRDEYMEKVARNAFPEGDYVGFYCWITGGRQGGNCWGDSPSTYTASEGEPENNLLTEICMKYEGRISYFRFRNIMQNLTVLKEYTIREYYGNHTDYKYRLFSLVRLYEAIFDE